MTIMVTGCNDTELLLRETLCCIFLSAQQKWYPLSPPPPLPLVVTDSRSLRLSIPLHLFFLGGGVITVSLAGLANDSLTYFGCQ